jgi:hypothetical protein
MARQLHGVQRAIPTAPSLAGLEGNGMHEPRRGHDDDHEVRVANRTVRGAVEPQRGDPDLVDAPAELTDEAKALFADHMSAASERAEWGAELTEPDGEVPAHCLRLLGTSAQFVDASKVLARRLFENMRARPKNSSAGDFVAIVYRSGHDSTRRIALLKLELDSRWATSFSGPAGRRRVRIAIAQNLFADTK